MILCSPIIDQFHYFLASQKTFIHLFLYKYMRENKGIAEFNSGICREEGFDMPKAKK